MNANKQSFATRSTTYDLLPTQNNSDSLSFLRLFCLPRTRHSRDLHDKMRWKTVKRVIFMSYGTRHRTHSLI